MGTVVLDQFIGELPRVSDQNIPNNAASVARNLRILSGNLRALHAPIAVDSFPFVTVYVPNYAFRVLAADLVDDNPYQPGPNSYPEAWVGFRYKGTKVVKGPVVKDQYERYYWTNEGQEAARYIRRGLIDSLGSVVNGNILGIPAPTTAPTVTPSGSGSAQDETRSYVYTNVSIYGEEGPPSPPGEGTGDPSLFWTISNMDEPDQTESEIQYINLYRTIVAADGSVDYTFVTQILVDQTGPYTYVDPGNSSVAGNEPLRSTTWFPPPTDLDGLVAHPNGFLVGFSGFDVYFSEVFQPHAWPEDYIVSVDTPIVALAIIDTSVVVLTQGSPNIISGIAPDSMAKTKIETAAPCLSRYSVVVMPDGVYYASNDGIVRVVAESVQVVTKALIDAQTWRTDFFPEQITACQDDEYYMAFYTDSQGFFLTPADPTNTVIMLDSLSGIDNILTDRLDGEAYMMINGTLFLWDPVDGAPLAYRWKSKEFVFPKPCNLGAFKIDFDEEQKTVQPDLTLERDYNIARLASDIPLQTVAWAPYAASRYDPGIVPDQPQIRLPVGGSSLFDLAALQGVGTVQFFVFARDTLIFSQLVTSEAVSRLPATVKTDKWQFELVGTTDVFYVKIAETGRQLAAL